MGDEKYLKKIFAGPKSQKKLFVNTICITKKMFAEKSEKLVSHQRSHKKSSKTEIKTKSIKILL